MARRPTRHDTEPLTALVITMAGAPRAKPRHRTIPGRRRPVSLTGKAKTYAQLLERVARDAVANLGGADVIAAAWGGKALVANILCQFPTPKRERWGQLHTARPDKDNLEKMVLDCLVKAGALGGDDSRAATGTTTKLWAETGSMTVVVELAKAPVDPTRRASVAPLQPAPAWIMRR